MASTSSPSPEALAEEVAAQNALVNDLRKQQADAATVEEAKKKLGELKRALALAQNAASGGGKGEKKKERMLLKTPKVRDCVAVCVRGLKLIGKAALPPLYARMLVAALRTNVDGLDGTPRHGIGHARLWPG